MKTKFLLCLLTVSMFAVVQSVHAQIGTPFGGMYAGGGGQVYEPGTFQPVVGDLQTGMPGRVWVEANLAERGLGYQGSYATLGMKRRLFEDFLDGRWLVEARAHHSLNGGGFFGNLGIERVFSIDSAGATVSMGLWADYDSDQQGNFAHTFGQIGVSGQIKTKRWDLLANGYFPEGTTSYTQGDPTGENCFFGHSVIVQAGIDSALKGFDLTLRLKPKQLAFANGTFEIGGYGYESDIVDFFGGGRARVGFQALNGMMVNTEVNYDERFDFTGVVGLGWMYGVNARANEYSALGRELEETRRNDHIVRFQQDVIVALDPDTGRPYNVYHVDNTADAAIGDGTVETRFTTLAEAEAASGDGDIIFVHDGDGTARGMENGIVLQNNQFFLGDGVEHVIPIQNGLNFVLCNDVDGNRPTISGSNNGNAVTLANNNVVAGFNIDGTQGTGNMGYGIFGSGFQRGETLTTGVIRDNTISGAILSGVHIEDVGGNWDFARNEITDNAFDGIRIIDACDPTSIFTFDSNTVSTNGQDGISIENYDALAINFLNNITNDNARHGISLTNFKNTLGNGLELNLVGHEASGNNGFGINIEGGDGNLRILNGNITGNIGGGLNIVNWTNTDPNTLTFIGTTTGGTSTFSNNLPGVGINVELNSGVQRVFVTDTTLNNNGFGFVGTSNGVGTQLITRILDNQSVSNNLIDGLRIVATNGGNHNTIINQPNGGAVAQLPITGNNGSGISFFAGDTTSGFVSIVEAVVRNVNASGNAVGIFGDVVGDGALQLDISDSTVGGNGNGMVFNLDGDETQIVNTIRAQNLQMVNNGLNGIVANVAAGTFLDFVLIDSVLTDTTTAIDATPGLGGGDINTSRLSSFGRGLLFNVAGDDALLNPQIDTRVRMLVQGNSINQFLNNGIEITTLGDAHLVARIEGNDMFQNGYGFGAGLDGTGAPAIVSPGAPVFDGIDITAAGTSRIDLRLIGNDITFSSERGVDMRTLGEGTINALWVGNDLSNNDRANDPTDDPIRNDDISDFDVNNAIAGNICLAMSNNFWNNGFSINNGGAVVAFVLELDGNSNLFNAADPQVTGAFSTPLFGSTCEGLIAGEEAAFEAEGFPPQP